MANSFLNEVAQQSWQRHGKGVQQACFIFPNQRAAHYFERALAAAAGEALLAPAILSMEECLQQVGHRTVPNRFTQVHTLYQQYHNYFPDEPLHRFYPWGELLVEDFSEVDRSGINAHQLFTHLADWESIGAAMALTEEDLESFQRFWHQFSKHKLGLHQQRFLALWEKLAPLYNDFNAAMASQGFATAGNLLRRVASQVLADEVVAWPGAPLYLIGFQGLSKLERHLFKHLAQSEQANIYWDADSYYLQELPYHEAGLHLRKELSITGTKPPSLLGNATLHIELVGAPLLVGQAQALGQLLQLAPLGKHFNGEQGLPPIPLNRTAVLLPDEKLLYPVLQALPASAHPINLTMGIPLRQTPLHSLLLSLARLWEHSQLGPAGETLSFYHEDVRQLFLHPYAQLVSYPSISTFLTTMATEGWLRVPPEAFQVEGLSPLLHAIFTPTVSQAPTPGYLRTVLTALEQSQTDFNPTAATLEAATLALVVKQVNQLGLALQQAPLAEDAESFWRILIQQLHNLHVPIAAKPLDALQVMGLYETRALDFDHVIIVGANEKTFPGKSMAHSFIPYALRKAVGMPTREDGASTAAYLFYRLLQRSKRLTLIYDHSGQQAQAEPSHFILQLKHELTVLRPLVSLAAYTFNASASPRLSSPTAQPKTAEVLQHLQAYTTTDATGKQKAFSASALQTYVSCQLKFYYHYIAQLAEYEEEKDEISPRLLGEILHATLQELYRPLVGQTLTPTHLDKLRLQLPAVLQTTAAAAFAPLRQQVSGENQLNLSIIAKLVQAVLLLDEHAPPTQLLAVEHTLRTSIGLQDGTTVVLVGKLDRLHRRGTAYQVWDYKTGAWEAKKNFTVEDCFTDPKLKELLQAYYYAYLMKANPTHQSYNELSFALLPLRKVREGPVTVLDASRLADTLPRFGQLLQATLQELLSPAQPFAPVTDTTTCERCGYYRLCYRS